MNSHLVDTNHVADSWPILLVYAIYVVAFAITALTMTSVFLVA